MIYKLSLWLFSNDWKKSRRDLMCVGRYAAKVMRNACKYRITNTHPIGMRFRIQWAIWCCRIPLECTILTNLLQAFRKDSISLRSITSFLHTCLHTSNPYGIFTIIIMIKGLLVYHCKKRYLLTNSLLITVPSNSQKVTQMTLFGN